MNDDIGTTDTLLEAHEKAALNGDFSLYAKILRERSEILEDDDRELIANKIEGNFKLKRGPRFKQNSLEGQWLGAFDIYCCYLWLVDVEKMANKQAYHKLSSVFEPNETTIRKRVKMMRNLEKAVASKDFLQTIRESGLDEEIFGQPTTVRMLFTFVEAKRSKIAEALKTSDPKNHQNKPCQFS